MTRQLPLTKLRTTLLDWYDREGRSLPWRVRPDDRARGETIDPYAVWLSEIMLQQTTVTHATPYYQRFLQRWPTVHDLAAAERDDVLAAWSGLGYYARARRLFECAQAVAAGGGAFPSAEKALLALPGVGPYTAAAIRALAFDRPANVVDGNVERVIARLHAVPTPLPRAKGEIRTLAGRLASSGDGAERPGDYAQALMDLGAVVCTPQAPACTNCPWSEWCAARISGAPTDYPRREVRKARPTRRGVAFVVISGGGVWLRRRPDEGLLGGMQEVPSTPWRDEPWSRRAARAEAPFGGRWRTCGEVRHIFTHFALELEVWRAAPPSGWTPTAGGFVSCEALATAALPSVMRKILAVGLD